MIAGPHLLLVDDEADLRESLGILLGFEGFRISEAPTGDEALILIEGGLEPDLILLDYRMPGLTGAQTLQRLRARNCHTPAVLLTAAGNAREIARQHGFDGVLTKPVSPDELITTLRRILASGNT